MNPNCDSFIERIPAYHDGKLAETERAEIRAHLETCAACREVAESLRLLGGAMEMSPLPAKLDAKRRAAINEKFRAVKAASAPKKKSFAQIIRFPKPSAATSAWLVPLSRAAVFVVFPSLLLTMMLMSGGMSSKMPYGMLARINEGSMDGKEVLPPTGAVQGSDEATPTKSELSHGTASSTTKTAQKGRKLAGDGWAESEQMRGGMVAEKKPARADVDNLKSEISTYRFQEAAQPADPQSAAEQMNEPARPALPRIVSAPPPALPPATRPVLATSNGGRGGEVVALGDIPVVGRLFRAPSPATATPAKPTGGAARPSPAFGDKSVAAPATPVTLATASGVWDFNGRGEATREVAAAGKPASGPAAANSFNYQITEPRQDDRRTLASDELGREGLTKNGSGTLALTGGNTFSGGTVVNGGTLVVNGTISGSGGVLQAPAEDNGGYDNFQTLERLGNKSSSAGNGDQTKQLADQNASFYALRGNLSDDQDALVVANGALGTRRVGGSVLLTGELDGKAKDSKELAQHTELFFDLAEGQKEVAKEKSDSQKQWFGTFGGNAIDSGGAVGGGAGGGGAALGAQQNQGGFAGEKMQQLARQTEELKKGSEREERDYGIVAQNQLALADTDADGRVQLGEVAELEKTMDDRSLAAVTDGEKLHEANKSAPDQRRRQLEVTDARAKRNQGEPVPLPTEYPKPMFVGTPVPIKVPNLEAASSAGTSTRSYDIPKSTMEKFKEGAGYDGLAKQLEASGVKTPAGSKASYDPDNGKLVVTSTPQGLSKFDDVVASLKAAEPVDAPRPTPPRKAAGFNSYVEATGDDAFSTFGIDVDTASYTLTRRAMDEGRLPDAEQVRTEEIVNAFDYDYAPPANGAFAMHAQLAPSPFRAPLELLKVGIQGRLPGRDAKKAAVLTLVIDVSGSMDTADRLGRIRTSLKMLAGKLQPQDSIAIVAFNTDARLLLDRTAGADQARILAAIDSLAASGSTQLEGGMRLAYEVAARGFVSGAANRVILMSDGVANLGAATAQEILASVEQYRKQGVYLTVLGFGSGNYDDAMLMTLADKGDGMYAFVDSDEEARRLLVDQWEQTMHVIAKDVKIQIEFNPDRVARWRQIGYEKRQLTKQDFRNDSVDAGEVGSGQAVTALYDIELRPLTDGQTFVNAGYLRIPPIATLRVRYKDPDTGKVTELEQSITDANRIADFAKAPARFRIAASAAEFAELLRVSPYTAGSDFAAVIEALRPAAAELPLDQRVQELLRLAERARALAK